MLDSSYVPEWNEHKQNLLRLWFDTDCRNECLFKWDVRTWDAGKTSGKSVSLYTGFSQVFPTHAIVSTNPDDATAGLCSQGGRQTHSPLSVTTTLANHGASVSLHMWKWANSAFLQLCYAATQSSRSKKMCGTGFTCLRGSSHELSPVLSGYA